MRIISAEPTVYRFVSPEGVFKEDWHVFDDDVCIDENVNLISAKEFELMARPVGTVRALLVTAPLM